MRTVRTVADLRAALRDAAPRRADDRPRPDDGRVPRRPPALIRARPRRARRRRRLAVRQPGAVQRGRRPRRLPARRGARRRGRGGRGRRPPVRPARRRGLPARVRDDGPRRRPDRASSRAQHRGVGALRRRRDRRLQAAQHRRSRTSRTSARRTPSRSPSIRRLVRDLDIPVRIEVLPTVREPDGLALSSRNVRLNGGRPRARARAAPRPRRRRARRSPPASATPHAIERAGRAAMARLGVEPEYVALVAPTTFAPSSGSTATSLVAVAARVGPTRLIDNTILDVPEPT